METICERKFDFVAYFRNKFLEKANLHTLPKCAEQIYPFTPQIVCQNIPPKIGLTQIYLFM